MTQSAVLPLPAVDLEKFPPTATTPTGLTYPTDIEDNRTWRLGIYAAVQHDPQGQAAWRERAAEDIEAWFATFLWTYTPPPRRKVALTPFSPWPVQRRALHLLQDSLQEGYDLLLEKSRDMGASWLCLGNFLHKWLFAKDFAFMLLSLTEDLVDKTNQPDSLFWKLDYALRYMPSWIKPDKIERTHMHLLNVDRQNVIDGVSTTTDPGRGGRRSGILVDEAAQIPNLEKVLAATADNAPCRIFNSTAHGQNMFYRMRMSEKLKVLTLPWWDCPWKSAGFYRDEDGKARSPWYDAEEARRVSKIEMAQEVDIWYYGSGEMFFDADVLMRLKSEVVRPPLSVGELLWTYNLEERTLEVGKWDPDGGKRRLRLWAQLDVEGNPSKDSNYVVGVDVSNGQGASNSVISVGSVNLKEKVAEFACPLTSPEDLARYAVAICRWFAGHNGHAFLLWEFNGPGGIFWEEVKRIKYPYFYVQRDEFALNPRRGKHPGWASTRRKKELLLGNYRRALARGDIVNYSEEGIEEATTYVYLPDGSLGPSSMADATTGARATHGDRVIADALCVMGFEEQPKAPPPGERIVRGSFAHRRLVDKARGKDDRWK